MNDETLLKAMKNGLMVAGHEMGPVGDHWPAIHALSNGLDKEFEQADRNEAVVGELEFHLAEAFREIEDIAHECGPQEKAQILAMLNEMWERYYAILEPVDAKSKPSLEDFAGDSAEFRNMKAAIQILNGLGGRA
ncbi:MAG TPA: hypothetical protein VHB73_06945 [Alphaproteobacteria bacterium]|nr:hypothetical protein [Alphaproteobacteria bacterium]